MTEKITINLKEKLDKLKSDYEIYINHPDIVYKSCGGIWLVMLQKLPYSVNNEKRKNIVDDKYAKYRANKLRVIGIINKFDCTECISEIENTIYIYDKIKYTVNSHVNAYNYDKIKTNVITTGIHYYKSIEPAFYEELNIFKEFNDSYLLKGTIPYWDENGAFGSYIYYNNDKTHNNWYRWRTNEIEKFDL